MHSYFHSCSKKAQVLFVIVSRYLDILESAARCKMQRMSRREILFSRNEINALFQSHFQRISKRTNAFWDSNGSQIRNMYTYFDFSKHVSFFLPRRKGEISVFITPSVETPDRKCDAKFDIPNIPIRSFVDFHYYFAWCWNGRSGDTHVA